jgi:hypothetical protein
MVEGILVDDEKRKQPRKEVVWPITIIAEHGTIEGEIRNITVDGLFIFCEEPLMLNQTYRMSIIPDKHQAIGVKGKVVWADAYCMAEDKSVYGMGVCLIEITKKDRQALGEILAGM